MERQVGGWRVTVTLLCKTVWRAEESIRAKFSIFIRNYAQTQFFSFSNLILSCVYTDLPLITVFLYQAYG